MKLGTMLDSWTTAVYWGMGCQLVDTVVRTTLQGWLSLTGNIYKTDFPSRLTYRNRKQTVFTMNQYWLLLQIASNRLLDSESSILFDLNKSNFFSPSFTHFVSLSIYNPLRIRYLRSSWVSPVLFTFFNNGIYCTILLPENAVQCK